MAADIAEAVGGRHEDAWGYGEVPGCEIGFRAADSRGEVGYWQNFLGLRDTGRSYGCFEFRGGNLADFLENHREELWMDVQSSAVAVYSFGSLCLLMMLSLSLFLS